MHARSTVLEMIKKCGREDSGVEGGRVAQIPKLNWVDNGEDECGGAAYACVVERVVFEAHLQDGFELSCLVFLFIGDCYIGADACGDDKGFFVRLEVVGDGSDDAPKVVLRMGFVISILEEYGCEVLAEVHEVVVVGLARNS